VLDEFDDLGVWGQFDQPLLQPHQQRLDLGGFSLGLPESKE
jgi:hypothetical protein